MILSARHINKSINGRTILKDCSLDLKAGECVTLRGPSGGGKSTFLRILALLEATDSGEVVYDDKVWNVASKPKESPYPFLSLVFQQLFLWPNLTNAQNVSLVLEHRPGKSLTRQVAATFDRFAVGGLMHRYPHECSLGERQRVAVARALVSNAKFLLLDEPSSALDSVNKTVLIDELKNAVANGRGILLVTHDYGVYDQLADRSLDLENGELRPL